MASFKKSFYSCCAADASVGWGRRKWLSADFNSAQSLVSAAEGGYTNNPSDRGNYTSNGNLIGTKFGISAPVLQAWLGYEPTVSDMQNLSQPTAIAIYKKNYWTPIKGDLINDDRLAAMIYDTAVNEGVGKAQSFVKDSLGISTYDINAINNADPTTLFNSIGARRTTAYNKLGGQFLSSWLNRLSALGYSGIDYAKNNIVTVILISLAVAAVITGIVLYKRK